MEPHIIIWFTIFDWEFKVCISLLIVCRGGDSCCSSNNRCDSGEGDCDWDSDCKPGLICGSRNCPQTGYLWDSTDDCCGKLDYFTSTLCNITDSNKSTFRNIFIYVMISWYSFGWDEINGIGDYHRHLYAYFNVVNFDNIYDKQFKW